MKLSALQQRFTRNLQDKAPSKDIASTLALAEEDKLVIFDIYLRNFYGGLDEVLSHTFPAAKTLVGEMFFTALVREFASAHPPQSGNLDDYGGALPGFVAGFAPAESVPYLADVTRFEWAYHCCELSDQPAPLDPAALQALTPEALLALKLSLHPGDILFTSSYPCLDIWRYATAENPEGELDISKAGDTLLMHKNDDDVLFIPLSQPEYDWLAAINHGHSLGEACEAVSTQHDEVDFSALIQKHLQTGTFKALDTA